MAPIEVKVGQIWKVRDSRFHRLVRIIRIKKSGAVVIQNEETFRHTTARSDKFFGNSAGYILWKDVQ